MTTDNSAPAAPAAAPAAAPQAPAAPAGTPPAAQTPSPSSQAPAAASDDVDLVTGAEAKPATDPAAEPPKAPETAAEKRAALEADLTEQDKLALKDKTDAEIEELFKAKQDEKAEREALGDFDPTKLTLPEDMPIPEEMKGKVNDLAKVFNDSKLTSQEKFQKAVDLHVEMQNKQLEDFKAVKNGWKEASLKDPELGAGNKSTFDATVGRANDVVRKFAGTPAQLAEFQKGLTFLGLGNHPGFIRFCNNISKATSDDSFDGDSKPGAVKKDLAAMMYPDMKQG